MKFSSKLGRTEVTRNGNFEVYETTLYLSGVTKPLTLLLGADTHLTLTDYRDDLARKNFMWQRRMWFPFAQDILEDIVNFPAQNPVDFTVLLGDMIDFPSEKNLEVLREFLTRKPLGSYLYIMGNHDYNFPEEGIEGTPESLTAIDALAVRLDGAERELTPKEYQGGFHAIDLGEVIIAGGNNVTKEGRTAILEGLNALQNAGKPVILCVHKTFYADTLTKDVAKAWGKDGTATLAGDEIGQALTKAGCPVAAVCAEDIHFFHTDVLENGMPQIVVSSQEKKIKTGTPAEKEKYWSGIGIVHLLPLEKQ